MLGYSHAAAAKSAVGISVPKRTTIDSVIMCEHSDACNKSAMVSWAGASQDAPGSSMTGYANPVQLPPPLRLASLGGDNLSHRRGSHHGFGDYPDYSRP
ncbi:ash family protein [Yersinia pekkanenii]|uniref:ash family protein n=1 Tax=Yersinia pekkanenii TaxID=1288385 RepID=UPI00092CF0B9|nr:ash family protein [Yersinia pekkanenii]